MNELDLDNIDHINDVTGDYQTSYDHCVSEKGEYLLHNEATDTCTTVQSIVANCNQA